MTTSNPHAGFADQLDKIRLVILKAGPGEARELRARLAGILRSGATTSPLLRRLAKAAFDASDFLRELAWMSEIVDPDGIQRKRQAFAVAIDSLIFEVDIAGLQRERRQAALQAQPVEPPRYVRSAKAWWNDKLARVRKGADAGWAPAEEWQRREPTF